MSLTKRITKLIDAAYEKGQTTITTTVRDQEIFDQEEVDQLITHLRAQGYTVTHDDVFNDMTIRIPDLTLAERARLIAYNADTVVQKQIQSISKDIIRLSRQGCTDTEEDYYDISDPTIIDLIHEHFSREGFNVVRTDNTKRCHTNLKISWGK